jgi:hypothetical protein
MKARNSWEAAKDDVNWEFPVHTCPLSNAMKVIDNAKNSRKYRVNCIGNAVSVNGMETRPGVLNSLRFNPA